MKHGAWAGRRREATARRAGTRKRWVLRVLLALLLLTCVLVLERTPAARTNPAPSAQDVRSAKAVYERVRHAQQLPGIVVISASWQELAAVASLGGRAAGLERVNVVPALSRMQAVASVRLPLGFWINGHAFVTPDAQGRPRISARIGDLPLPPFIVHPLIGVARWVLRLRGARIAPLDQVLPGVRIDGNGIAARVDLPDTTGLVRSLSGLVSEPVDAQRVGRLYCALTSAQQAEPTTAFVDHVRRVFGAADGSVPDNRAAFVALSLLAAGMDAGALGGGAEAVLARCGRPGTTPPLLQGRGDLAMHWAVSGALSTAFGTDVSLSVGLWKEISDSGEGGSGFSLVDLAADRSGVFFAQRASAAAEAMVMRAWLMQADETDLLPVAALALSEGMTEAEFRAQFADTDSAGFAATVQRIDAQLAVLMR